MDNTIEETRYFEDYLEITGWGLYNNLIVALACICNLVQGVTFVTIPLAIVVSSCDDNFIPETIILRIFTSFYFGSLFGGLIANFLSDRYGRKRYLTYSLMLLFLATFTAAFAYNAYVIIGASLILGVGSNKKWAAGVGYLINLETITASIKLLLIEILPKKTRGSYMILCDMFWVLGYMLTTVMTILFGTSVIFNNAKSSEMNLKTWRIMFAVSGGANLLVACACALIEESPRYFLQMRRSYLAYLVLKQLYAINNSSFAENFKVKEDELKNLIRQYDLFYLEPEPYWDIFKKLIWRFRRSLQLIFSKRFCRTTCIIILLKIPVFVLGILQLHISLTKQVSYSTSPNISQNEYKGLDFVYPVLKPMTYKSRDEFKDFASICTPTEYNNYNFTFYKYYLGIGSFMLIGLGISMLLVDWLGRKFLLFAGLLLSSCSFLALHFIKQIAFQFIFSSIILASISSVISAISLLNLEAFPTAIRGTTYSVTSVIGLVLAIFFINFIVIDRRIYTIIMGILYFCLSIFTFFLPELKGKPMIE